jgi:ABC-type glycerol-3-phosphate transport system permease component
VFYALVTMIPLVWIIMTGFKTPAGLHQLPAQGGVQPVGGGLLQPVHHALAADADEYIASLPPAEVACENASRAPTADGGGRAFELRAALCQLADHRVWLDRCYPSALA